MMTFSALHAAAPTGIDAGCVASVFLTVNSELPGAELRCNFGSVAIKSYLHVEITARGAR